MVPGRNACLYNALGGNRETPGWGCKPFAIFWTIMLLLLAGKIASTGTINTITISSGAFSALSLLVFWRYCQDCDGWKGLWVVYIVTTAAMFVPLAYYASKAKKAVATIPQNILTKNKANKPPSPLDL
jgi:hypothetical protein